MARPKSPKNVQHDAPPEAGVKLHQFNVYLRPEIREELKDTAAGLGIGAGEYVTRLQSLFDLVCGLIDGDREQIERDVLFRAVAERGLVFPTYVS